jgi:hypothetical protein
MLGGLKGVWATNVFPRPLFCMCFSIVSLPLTASFSVQHIGRSWVQRSISEVTTPRINSLRLPFRSALNPVFRRFSCHKQVLSMATTRLEFGVEPAKVPATGSTFATTLSIVFYSFRALLCSCFRRKKGGSSE